jgi:uncharacterized Zn finger protein
MKNDSLHVNGITIVAEVQGSAVKPYRIGYNKKQYTCSCPAWTKGAHMRENCKHIKRVIIVVQGGKDKTVSLTSEGIALLTATSKLSDLVKSL